MNFIDRITKNGNLFLGLNSEVVVYNTKCETDNFRFLKRKRFKRTQNHKASQNFPFLIHFLPFCVRNVYLSNFDPKSSLHFKLLRSNHIHALRTYPVTTNIWTKISDSMTQRLLHCSAVATKKEQKLFDTNDYTRKQGKKNKV